MRAAILLVAFVLTAGCFSRDVAPDQEADAIHTAPNPETKPLLERAGTSDASISFTDCFGTISVFGWPGDAGPGNYPEGWEPATADSGVLGSRDFVEIFSCKRLSWGQFERPFTFLIESHDKFTPHGACGNDSLPTLMLHSIWTNDAEVAAWLVAEYQLPARIAEISSAFANTTELAELTWTWNLIGQGASSLTSLIAAPEPQDGQWHEGRHYLVDRQPGISVIDLNFTTALPSSPEQIAFGSFDATTLHGSAGISPYLGTSDYWLSMNGSGKISNYGDYSCEN